MNDNKRVLIPIRARGDLIGFWIPGAGPAILFRSLFIMPVYFGRHMSRLISIGPSGSIAAISKGRVSRIYHTDERLAGHIIKDNVSCIFSHN